MRIEETEKFYMKIGTEKNICTKIEGTGGRKDFLDLPV